MRTRVFPCLTVLIVVLQTHAFSQTIYEPLPVEELLSVRTFADFVPIGFSPDDEWVAYTLRDNRRKEPVGDARYRLFSRTGVFLYGGAGDIWVTNMKSGQSKNVTGDQGNNWSPAWSPDGRHIAFYSDRGGQANVWVWEKATGKLRQVSTAVVRSLANPIQWMPDSRQVLIKVLPEDMTLEEAAKLTVASQEQSHNEKKASGSTVVVYSSSKVAGQDISANPPGATTSQTPPWNLNRDLADLVVLDVFTGQVKRVIQDRLIRNYWLSADASNVAYTISRKFEVAGSQQILYDLAVFSFSTGQARVVAPHIQLDYDGSSVSWSPDGKMLSYRTAGQLAKGDVFVVPATGGEPRNLTAAPHPSFAGFGLQPPLWDAAAQNIYFIGANALWKTSLPDGKTSEIARISDERIELLISKDGNRLWSPDDEQSTILRALDAQTNQNAFYKVDLKNGQSTVLLKKGKFHSNPPIYGQVVSNNSQRIVYLAQDTQHGADLWLADADFRLPKRLTQINRQLERYRMGEARLIEWNSLDGQRLRGALLLPSEYQEGRRYPLITKVYGGGLLSDDINRFGFARAMVDNLQILATRGYAVLLPDSPMQVGSPMADLLKTVMPGVNKAVEIGVADPDRLGLMGHSNGGYSALTLLVQTKRFKAAMTSAGYGDLLALYGQIRKDGANYGLGFVEKLLIGGTAWEYRERYIENSPIYYLDRVQTPLLIVHGGADDAILASSADEIFVGLRRLGKDVTYAKYEGEEHWQGNWGYANQVDYLNRLIGWFNKHLKDDRDLKVSRRAQ